MITVHGFTRSKVESSVTAFLWRWRVPETCSLPYQISYAMKFERSLSMRSGNLTASRPLQNGTFCAGRTVEGLLKKMNIEHRTSNSPEASKHLSASGGSNDE